MPRSTCWIVVLLSAVSIVQPAYGQPTVVPRAGLVITRSVAVRPGTYRLSAPIDSGAAVITVRGDDIDVDLRGVTLVGVGPARDPDSARGIAIRIDGGRNVRIRNGRVRGYKIGILAQSTRELRIEDVDLSHNWKPRLHSRVEHESLADWLSFHQNDKGEWLRFGAAVFLVDVKGGELRGNTVHQGMNGLLMTRTDSVRVIANEFSFNSGLGIGLYRSSDNVILHNRADYNVRGYSHGFYRRGQDSAALLLYEQSCRNVVAFNSMTHSGDGLFLWAGQSTMDSGQGGANDNLFYANDFSYAPTNGMEATFSRNAFVGNVVKGSEYGLWAGYSFESQVVANLFSGNRHGVAIEHGQANVVRGNIFDGDSTAISLWANPIEPSDWGYPKHRDTKSRDYTIRGNRFNQNRVALRVANTVGLTMRSNAIVQPDTAVVARDTMRIVIDSNATAPERDHEALFRVPDVPADWVNRVPRPLENVPDVRNSLLAQMPRSAIVVDEWGPYDWRSPKLWPVDSTRSVPLRLQVLGPAGRWRVASMRNVARVSRSSGALPDTIAVAPRVGSEHDWGLTLEYVGAASVSPRGAATAAGTPVRFSYERFEPRMTWEARFHAWNDNTDLRTSARPMERVLTTAPIVTQRPSRLDYMWYRPLIKELPLERWALEATGRVSLPSGAGYVLRTISDDGIRVWVDGVLVIDRWSVHESQVDEVPIRPGAHHLRVQYFQSDGWAELRVEIVRR